MRRTLGLGMVGIIAASLFVLAPAKASLSCPLGQTAIVIQNFSFTPQTVTVAPGATVCWENHASATNHTSTSDTAVWDSGTLMTNQTFSRTFSTGGSFPYHCTIHPFMTGTVVVDNTPPPPPTFSSTVPASPANDNDPEIKGSAESGSKVQLFTDSTCNTSAGVLTNEATFEDPGISVHVIDNSMTTFYGKAVDAFGNLSGCSSGSITYAEDSTLLGPPQITGSTPASPSNDHSPTITGSGTDGTTVRLYTTSDCSGSELGSAVVGGGTFSIPITVDDDATTHIYGRAFNGPTQSSCGGPFTYVEDSTGPSAVNFTTKPKPKTRSRNANFVFTPEAGATYTCQLDSNPAEDCSDGSVSYTKLKRRTHTLLVTGTDALGNPGNPSSYDWKIKR